MNKRASVRRWKARFRLGKLVWREALEDNPRLGRFVKRVGYVVDWRAAGVKIALDSV